MPRRFFFNIVIPSRSRDIHGPDLQPGEVSSIAASPILELRGFVAISYQPYVILQTIAGGGSPFSGKSARG